MESSNRITCSVLNFLLCFREIINTNSVLEPRHNHGKVIYQQRQKFSLSSFERRQDAGLVSLVLFFLSLFFQLQIFCFKLLQIPPFPYFAVRTQTLHLRANACYSRYISGRKQLQSHELQIRWQTHKAGIISIGSFFFQFYDSFLSNSI